MRDEELQKKIMRGVGRVYLAKKATSKTACRLYMLTAILLALQPFVSFTQVLRNMPRAIDPMYYYNFAMSAVMHTEAIVQVALLLVAGIVAWTVVDALRKTGDISVKRVTP